MKIQLALDRMTISEGIDMVQQVREYIDWIEVGTSLIKEFGMRSVKEMREAFPEKIIVADAKTIDNAKYEFELCYEAGADVATVMGVAPDATIETCMKTAERYGKQVMIDLLNTTVEQQNHLTRFEDAIFCDHVSKDEQEIAGKKKEEKTSSPIFRIPGIKIAVAGGITLESLNEIKRLNPSVVIIGSAITKAEDPAFTSLQFEKAIKNEGEGQ